MLLSGHCSRKCKSIFFILVICGFFFFPARIILTPCNSCRYNCLDRVNKISVDSFKTALEFVGVAAETEEVECMLANMIAQVMIWLLQEQRNEKRKKLL